ncbi:UDP-N-acetylglucosamine 2-epimerase (non-hydrolyzing) [Lentimicrobium sp. L6]|uniref:non-hydrolyzing UDP-N-acetylglucosamine 2-epimerase n=1 Tax=Lentimicrobium sp. L6 TaxID=2735916 RepID=UPI001557E043|nr:UDP-N-acetylglucosamine 2-epimerase (non-hydrolyzing) [Lentimicrobium sp. L6]NPD84460.1 UDP-N-acetylglucosamine 2-epimerase (non-hydrolyzing) [Lentimicrobium sp. L6]
MKKIVTIIGARPQIIKAAALSRAIKNHFQDQLKEIIVHTGQHYDANMSEVFFEELSIPRPDYNLNVGSGKHGEQTAKMIQGIEEILISEKPNALVLYGDTNSTLAGAIAASKIHIPIVHIEAGLRSFNKSMPEEINRIMCDHASTLLFSPTPTGYRNLINEGFKELEEGPFSVDRPKVYHSGDVMYDNSLHFSTLAKEKSSILVDEKLEAGSFILGTIHRDNNTDIPERLTAIFEALLEIAQENKIILPLHPRTKKKMQEVLSPDLLTQITNCQNLQLIAPVSFLDMVLLEDSSKMIITDSGGVQKESFFFKKPCLILRPETEWVEIVEAGAARICDADKDIILKSYRNFMSNPPQDFEGIFGDGQASKFICGEILECL